MNFRVAIMEIRLYAPWVHSLKEKRMIVKSLLGKIRNRYWIFLCGSTAVPEERIPPIQRQETAVPEQRYRT